MRREHLEMSQVHYLRHASTLLALAPLFIGTGCSKEATPEPAADVAAAPATPTAPPAEKDPVAELEKLARSYAGKEIIYVDNPKFLDGDWTKTHVVVVGNEASFDVKKTDSLVSPLVGTIEITIKRLRAIGGTGTDMDGKIVPGFFVSKAQAVASKTWEPLSKIVQEKIRGEFAWRNKQWVCTHGGDYMSTGRLTRYEGARWPFRAAHPRENIVQEK